MANNIKPAERLSLVQEYYFSRKLKEVARLNAEGRDIISLAIGSPDMPPSHQTIERLCQVAQLPNAHGYQPTMGTPELRAAMARYYKKTYNVDVDPVHRLRHRRAHHPCGHLHGRRQHHPCALQHRQSVY